MQYEKILFPANLVRQLTYVDVSKLRVYLLNCMFHRNRYMNVTKFDVGATTAQAV